MFRLLTLFLALATTALHAETTKVAVLHPLLADLARQVGGDHVEIIDLIGPNGDPHHFEPAPADLKRAEGAKLYLLSGMGLEGYLPKLKTIVGNSAILVEIGKTLPALEEAHDHDHDHGDHDHSHGLDPHWWHSIDLFRRATTVVADAFEKADPANGGDYRKNAGNYRTSLDGLERWAKREIAKIPRDRRQLATAHAAFNYFCKDFGFTPHSVQGINREQTPNPQELAALVKELKDSKVGAVFPERESNPKVLQVLTADTGIKLGEALFADGTAAGSYEAMVRHNVGAIVKALAPTP